jgi:hypothetical protein
MLLHGIDAIEETLKLRDKIEAFRTSDKLRRPWVYEIAAPAAGSTQSDPDLL